ncbi:MAG: endonuclease/exonuclease/phosphatase family protein [Pseudomonadota bacterium]
MSKFLFSLAALWGLFAISHELFTGKLWFWVLPGMSPPILFAAIPAVIAVVALFNARYRTGMLVIAFASFLVSNQSTGINFASLMPRETPATVGAPIKVVQMNTDYWGQLRDGTLTDPRNKDAMLAYLRDLDADVYLLQEHMNRDGDFAPPVTDLSDVAEIFPEYEAATAGTLLTLSRLPIVEQSVVNPNTSSELHLPPPPYALKVNVMVGDQVFSTYNVHMPIQIIIEKNWFSQDFYDEIRKRHYIRQDEFRVLTQDLKDNPYPLVIAGDLNTSPAMGDNRELLDVTTDAASFSDMLYPATWRVGGQLPKLWRNDWFMIRNDLTVTNYQSLDPDGNSDHLVQSVDLLLTQEQAIASNN